MSAKYLSVFSCKKLFSIILHNYFSLHQVYLFEILQNPNPALRNIHWNICSVLYVLNACGDDLKSQFIWDVNFKHAPLEKVPNLRHLLMIN